MAKSTTRRMPEPAPGRTFVSAGVSIDPELLSRAKIRAEKLRMGWSEYVRRCLEADLHEEGDLVIKVEKSDKQK